MTKVREPTAAGPSAGAADGNVTVTVDGRPLRLDTCGSLAGALLSAGFRHLRDSPRAGAPRGALCFMGACQECAILIDGGIRQACLTAPRDGMVISLRGPR